MKPPSFWQNPPQKPGLAARILQPFSWLYAFATAKRLSGNGYRAKVPVICVGNLNAGGTGKTPTTIAIVQMLSGMGKTCHVVSRGYGGNLTGPVQVNLAQHQAAEVGDEPLLLAAFAPTWVAKDRAEGVKKAEDAGADVIILDDGFQNPSVVKQLSIVVVDAAKGFGNGMCLPAGPLREPVAVGLARADLLLSIGPADSQKVFSETWGRDLSVQQITAQTKPVRMGIDWQGQRVLAFAGIGYPEKFFATLREEGAEIAKAVALNDHQPISELLLSRLEREAEALNAQLVTTEKDQIRLPEAQRHRVLAMVVRLEFNDAKPLERALKNILAGKAAV